MATGFPNFSVGTNITPVSGSDLYFGFGGLTVDLQRPGTILLSSLNAWYPDALIYRASTLLLIDDSWEPRHRQCEQWSYVVTIVGMVCLGIPKHGQILHVVSPVWSFEDFLG